MTEKDPNRYVSNNLTIAAWTSLAALQSAARRAGLNPSKSAVLMAAARVATHHLDELTSALKESSR